MLEAQNDRAHVESLKANIRRLAAIGVHPFEIHRALDVPASAVDRFLKGGELFPKNFVPNRGRF